jgi:hypothetical protein
MSTSWTITLEDNPPVPVLDLTSGPGTREVTAASWPFGPDAMLPAPRSCPAALERHDGSAIVERISGQAWSTGVAIADDRGTRFQLRFVPDLVVDP